MTEEQALKSLKDLQDYFRERLLAGEFKIESVRNGSLGSEYWFNISLLGLTFNGSFDTIRKSVFFSNDVWDDTPIKIPMDTDQERRICDAIRGKVHKLNLGLQIEEVKRSIKELQDKLLKLENER